MSAIVTERPRRRRSLLLHGLLLLLSRPGALLWTFALNLAVALLCSAGVHGQLSTLLDHSLAAERLNSAFDLGTLASVVIHLQQSGRSAGDTSYLGTPLYLLGYFLLVPGALFCYSSSSPARLSILLTGGVRFFWRFLRITLLTIVVSGLLLGALGFLLAQWAAWVDEHVVGAPAYWSKAPLLLLLLLTAALLRLYFDLVEVYTVQLDEHLRPSGKSDRRVRCVLRHAWGTLRRHFVRAYGSFLLLTLAGLACFAGTVRLAAYRLAQPHSLPLVLLLETGLLLMMATRFWQRGAETTLARDNPLPVTWHPDDPFHPDRVDEGVVARSDEPSERDGGPGDGPATGPEAGSVTGQPGTSAEPPGPSKPAM